MKPTTFTYSYVYDTYAENATKTRQKNNSALDQFKSQISYNLLRYMYELVDGYLGFKNLTEVSFPRLQLCHKEWKPDVDVGQVMVLVGLFHRCLAIHTTGRIQW